MWLLGLIRDVNFVAVLVASVITFALAAIWYGPLFGKAWMELCNLKEDDIKDSRKPMVGSFVLSFLTCFILAVLVERLDVEYWTNGVLLGIGLSVGFYAFNIYSDFLFERRPQKLVFILSGYRVLSGAIMGLVLVLW